MRVKMKKTVVIEKEGGGNIIFHEPFVFNVSAELATEWANSVPRKAWPEDKEETKEGVPVVLEEDDHV